MKEIFIDDIYSKINNALFGGSIIFLVSFLSSGFNLLKSWSFVFVSVCLYALYEFFKYKFQNNNIDYR